MSESEVQAYPTPTLSHRVEYCSMRGLIAGPRELPCAVLRLADKDPAWVAVLALRFDVPVCFMDMLRLPGGKFRVVFELVQVERTGDREAETDAMVREYSRILEKWVRAYPDRYFWQHRRWRRQPEGTPPEGTPPELRDPAPRDPSAWTPAK